MMIDLFTYDFTQRCCRLKYNVILSVNHNSIEITSCIFYTSGNMSSERGRGGGGVNNVLRIAC